MSLEWRPPLEASGRRPYPRARPARIVHFLLPGFPMTPPRNHNHPQLGKGTPADGGVKDLPWLGYIVPHGGLAGA